jgi:hypothetical protein
VAVRHDPVSVFVWAVVMFAPLVAILHFASPRGARRSRTLSASRARAQPRPSAERRNTYLP